ncbi:lanthionine synthetase C family protein, partial [Streptomyces sp. MUM 203J]|uniref:lanthionine synthetase C family protein n=1 Tax=Streptomyces sp. MUM 203J TaxID=2791990 RepID=UPI001F045A27
LRTGQAGIALARLRFAREAAAAEGGTPDPALVEAALRTAADLDAVARGKRVPGLAAPEPAGLLDGLTGAALLHLELHAHTGEPWLLDAAATALRSDAARCVTMPGGTVQVRYDGRRHLLYVDRGSAGLALVVRRYLAHREDPALAGLIPGVRRGCAFEFVREPGLYSGRAGLLAAGHGLDAAGEGEGPAADLTASVRNLSWHLVAEGDLLLVPGAGLLRHSADLATGAAGLLLALHVLSGAGGTGGAVPDVPDLLTLG